MRVLGGTIPRMVFAEMVEDLLSDQDLIRNSPRAPFGGMKPRKMFGEYAGKE
jgi:hypothetical protein